MMRQFPLAAFNPPSGLFRSTLSLRRIPPEAPLGLVGCEGGIMQDPKAASENTWNGGQIVAWVVLLFFLIFLCLLPFLIGGVTLSGLGKLSPSSPLFALCIAGFTFVGYTPTLSALLVAGFFPGGGGARSVLRQVRTWRLGISWYAIALFGPAVLFLLDEAVYLVLGGSPPQHWIVLPPLSGFFLVRCSLVLWECSPGLLAKSSAGAVLLSHGCRSAMARSRPA